MSQVEALDRMADLLPEGQREAFFASMASLRDVPDEDEILRILEAMGFMTLILREVPDKLETILTKAQPTDRNGTRETVAVMVEELKTVIRETLDQPTYQDLRAMLCEVREGQQAFQCAVKRLETVGTNVVKGRSSGFGPLGMVAACAVGFVLSWIWFKKERERWFTEIESQLPAAETLVRMLKQSPPADLSIYDDNGVRGVVIDGAVLDAFVDEEGRGVVRLRDSDLSFP